MVSWQVNVDGADYVVSVSAGANNKSFVRVNGRIATSPIVPGEDSCTVLVGGQPYVIVHQGDSFELIAGERESATAVPPPQRRSFAKTIIAWAVVAAVVIVTGAWFRQKFYENSARDRVTHLLEEMTKGGDAEMKAIALWNGRRAADLQELSSMSDRFVQWCASRGLYRRSMIYRVIRTEFLWKESEPTAIVTFEANGTELEVRVPRNRPLEWVSPAAVVAEGPLLPAETAIPVAASKPAAYHSDRPPSGRVGQGIKIDPPKAETKEELPGLPTRVIVKPATDISVMAGDNSLAMNEFHSFTPLHHAFKVWAINDTSADNGKITTIEMEASSTGFQLASRFDLRIVTKGQPLEPGRYDNLKLIAGKDAVEFYIAADYHSCSLMGGGSFDIRALEYKLVAKSDYEKRAYYVITRFEANFSLRCSKDDISPAIGEIHYFAEPRWK